jgi:hypothetical protein
MRRGCSVLCLGLALLAATAPTAPAGVCAGVTAVDVFFWPQGHGAVPELNFPAFPPPHLELYRSGFPSDPAFLAYANASTASYSSSCVPAGRPPGWAGGPEQRSTVQQRLRCALPADADARRGPWTRVILQKKRVRVKGKLRTRTIRRTVTIGSTFTVSAGGGALVQARIGRTGSSLRWDSRYCAAIPLLS